MAIYEFICNECEVTWDREASMAKAPRRTKCPSCKKLREQNFTKAPPVIYKGTNFRDPGRKDIKARTNKQDLNEWYDSETKLTKERLAAGGNMYRHYVIDTKDALEKGKMSVVSDAKYKERVKKVKIIRQETSNMRKNSTKI